jgi:hypothetical protein
MAIPTATSSDPHLQTIFGVILRRPFGRPPDPCDGANSGRSSSRLLHRGNRWTWGRIRQPSPWAGWQFHPAKLKIPSSRGPPPTRKPRQPSKRSQKNLKKSLSLVPKKKPATVAAVHWPESTHRRRMMGLAGGREMEGRQCRVADQNYESLCGRW